MFGRHVGGEVVRGGVYWGKRVGEFVSVPVVGGILPGGPRDSYVETPLPLVLIAGPLMGLAFAIFLPLSGLLVLATLLVGRAWGDEIEPRARPIPPDGNHSGAPDLESPLDAVSAVRAGDGRPVDGTIVALASEIAERRWREGGRA